MGKRFLSAAAMILALASLARPLFGHDPKPVLRSIYGAPYAVLTMYQVKPGMENSFLDAMVSSGPYNRLSSGFANERIIQPLPGETGTTCYVSLGRYYDLSVARFVDSERQVAVSQYLAHPPSRLEVSLIEHELADWGWEKGTTTTLVKVKPLEKEQLFRENLSSLSFFKSGYVGQVGVLEFFPAATSLDAVRAELKGRRGLSGASIFSVSDGGYVVYSEYFVAPANMGGHGLRIAPGSVSGAQAGVVVQNYVAR